MNNKEVQIERERCASIADGLAEKWEARGQLERERGLRRFFGFGKAYTHPRAEKDACIYEAAAHGLRAVAKLIRDGAVRR